MIRSISETAVRARWAAVFVTLVVAAIGVWNIVRLPIDAVPDITNKQVQINTVAPEFGPLDIERLVTYPVETALSGIVGLESTRSISRNGFSQVTAVFRDDVDVYFARQQVAERLGQARENLPAGAEPQMGPISTGLGEVLMWAIRFKDKSELAADGAPGWRRDGSFLTVEGERLTDDVSIAVGLGRVYLELEMLDEAADQFERVEMKAPDHPVVHAYLGAVFERRGEMREACEEYRRALRLADAFTWPQRCTACAATVPAWRDRCPHCGRFNTLRSSDTR